MELPTGDYDRVDDQGTIERPDVQPGSGSTDWIFGLSHARPWGGVIFFSAASFTLSGESPLLYRFGDELDVSAGISRQTGKRVQVLRPARPAHRGGTTSSAGWRSRTPERRS